MNENTPLDIFNCSEEEENIFVNPAEPTFEELQYSVRKHGAEATASNLEDITTPRAPLNESTEEDKPSPKSPVPLPAQAVALSAIDKVVKAKLAEVRQDITDEMIEAFYEDGSDRKRAMLGGVNIGTVTLRNSKPGYKIVDKQAFEDYLRATPGACNREATCLNATEAYEMCLQAFMSQRVLKPSEFESKFIVVYKPTAAFEKLLENVDDVVVNSATGEVVPGIEPKPSEIIGVTIKPDKVKNVWRTLSLYSKKDIGNLLGAGD